MHTCKCADCDHLIFDEVWGEYKCKKFKHRIYGIEKMEECEGYEPKKKKRADNGTNNSINRHGS